jgi:hypothetical protein
MGEREPTNEPIKAPSWRTVLRALDRRVQDYLHHPTDAALARLFAQQLRLERELAKPGRFELGRLVQTPGAHEAMATALHVPAEFLLRHKQGDWGELPSEDHAENERAVREGSRIFSAYRTRRDAKLWVITEWDRSATTLLLPEEY